MSAPLKVVSQLNLSLSNNMTMNDLLLELKTAKEH